jgi:hypothetical protein
MGDRDPWVSATDLADYAYCPRSHWYHEHPPRGGPSPAARERAAFGQRFHARVLSGERRRAAHGAAYWAALGVGVLLVLGALAWIFHP